MTLCLPLTNQTIKPSYYFIVVIITIIKISALHVQMRKKTIKNNLISLV